MGSKQIKRIETAEERQAFMRHILNDIAAMEEMLRRGDFESGIQRIGAEQEINFVGPNWRPAPIATDFIAKSKLQNITTEYARFNLELNVPPLEFRGNCLSVLHQSLLERVRAVQEEAAAFDAKVILTGILPTIRREDLTLEALTPEPRYRTMLQIVNEMRGKNYEYHIRGLDELITRDNPTVFGGSFTSFQVHLQVAAEEMAQQFNWAQAISGPLLAACTNSPIFLGKRLWRETRIALFQQTTDTRRPYVNYKDEDTRVFFGNEWVQDTILDVFRDEVVRYRAFVSTSVEEDSLEKVREGQAPQLTALNFHNGTVYQWNRPCYGITDGKPHLRIENRILPAGPTVVDEVANAAFWLGMMNGMPEEYRTIHEKLDFADAKSNFYVAANLGLDVQFRWPGHSRTIPAEDLILKELLPMAREGLKKAKVKSADIDQYLGIIEERVKTEKTGAWWILESYNTLRKEGSQDEALVATLAAMSRQQDADKPVHEWELPQIAEAGSWKNRFWRVSQVMTNMLYTVQEDDMVDLVAHIMQWKNIGHVPVEDKNGHLKGLITKDSLISYVVRNPLLKEVGSTSVKGLMLTDVPTVSPNMLLVDAIKIMLEKDVSCLPVVDKRRLVGIITEHDFVTISEHLFHELLQGEDATNPTKQKRNEDNI